MKRKILFAVVLFVFAMSVFTVQADVVGDVASEQEVQLFSDLVQHSTPTGLKWGVDNFGNVRPGTASWDSHADCNGKYYIAIYLKGEEYPVFSTSFSTFSYNGRSSMDFNGHGFNQSGTYYFTVIARGDNSTYSDSEAAISEDYVFTLPSQKLDAPKNVTLTKNCIVTHSKVANAGYYEYKMSNGNRRQTTTGDGYSESEIIENDLSGWSGVRNDGEWEFTVKAITSNIELYQNSDESESIKVTIENGVITKIDGVNVEETEDAQITISSDLKITLKGGTLGGSVYAALYEADGSLKDLKIFNVDKNEFTPSFSDYTSGDKVKAMWLSDELKPVCKSAEL